MPDPISDAARLSVAPMMDWTDRNCRRFHRLMSRRALLYTEMVTAPAIIHGDRPRLLDHDAAEHPVALQLRIMQVLSNIAAEKNSTIVFPAQLLNSIRDVKDFMESELGVMSKKEK